MAIDRGQPPDHVDALPVTRADDGADRDDLTIGGQLHRRPGLHRRRHIAARGIASPTRDPHRRQGTADRLDLGRDAQIQAGLERNRLEAAQLHHRQGLGQFQTAAEILIRRHIGRIGLRQIAALPGQPVVPRPQIKPRRKRRWHQDQPFGNCLVHALNPFPLCPWGPCPCGEPVRWARARQRGSKALLTVGKAGARCRTPARNG